MKSVGKRSKLYILKYMLRITELWIKYPYLRFCQLILNVVEDSDIYYIEDDELKRLLKKGYKEK